MKRRFVIAATITALLISGALATFTGDSAQAAGREAPPVQTYGSTWS